MYWTPAMLAWLVALLWAVPETAGAQPRTERVDFDSALIKGQTNQGAVRLIERQDSDLGSMVKKRVHFRERILAPYGFTVEPGLKREPAETDPAGASGETATGGGAR